MTNSFQNPKYLDAKFWRNCMASLINDTSNVYEKNETK